MAIPKFREKDLVWAKMRGYPAWPARVTKPPRGQKGPKNKHCVFFYGTHEHAWMAPADIFPYQEHKERFKKNMGKKGFVEALWEIEEDPALKISSSVTLPARKGQGKKRQRSPQQELSESPTDHGQQTGSTPGAPLSSSDAPPTKKGRDEVTEESATPSGDSQEPLVSQKDTQKQSQDPSSPLPEERVTHRGMTMRNRQVLSSPQYYSRALSPCKVTVTGSSSEGTGPSVQDQTGVVGSSSDTGNGNETSNVRNSYDIGNRNETTSSTPPESSEGAASQTTRASGSGSTARGKTGTQGDCHSGGVGVDGGSGVGVDGGKDGSSTDSCKKQIDVQGSDIGPLATPVPDRDGESSSSTSTRTRTGRRRAQVKLAAALEESTSKAISSQEQKSENSTCFTQGTSSEDLQRTKSETDTPQEDKSETKTVGRDHLDSSQEDPSGGRRYSMRQRHASGSSGIVEQLTQSYMARKEQLGSPPTTPTAVIRLRSPLRARRSVELDLESSPVKSAGVRSGRVGGGTERRSGRHSGWVEPEVLDTVKIVDVGANVREAGEQPMPAPEVRAVREAGEQPMPAPGEQPMPAPELKQEADVAKESSEGLQEAGDSGGLNVSCMPPQGPLMAEGEGPAVTTTQSTGESSELVLERGVVAVEEEGLQEPGSKMELGRVVPAEEQKEPRDGPSLTNASVMGDGNGPVSNGDIGVNGGNRRTGEGSGDGQVESSVSSGSGLEQGGEGRGLEQGGEGRGLEQGGEGSGLEQGGEGSGLEQGGEGRGLEQGGEAEKKLCETSDEQVAMETGGPGGLAVSVEDGCSDASKLEGDAGMRGEEEREGNQSEAGAGERVSGGQASLSAVEESSVQPELPVHIPVQSGMTSIQQLQVHNYNLKAALTVEQPSVQRAMVVLQDLLEIQCLASDIQQVPDIVKTIRKVRRYQASPKVQGKAEAVYTRLKQMFLQPDQPVPPTTSLPWRRMLPVIGVCRRPGFDNVSTKCGISDIIGKKPSAQELQRLSIPTVPNKQADTPTEVGATGASEPLRRSSRGHSKVDYRGLDKEESGPESESGQDNQTVPAESGQDDQTVPG